MVSLLAPNLLDSLSLEDVADRVSRDQDTVITNHVSRDQQDTVLREGTNESPSDDTRRATLRSVTMPTHILQHDINIAGMLVTDALNFRNVAFRPEQLTLYQVYQDRATRFLFALFPVLLLGLALIEKPAVATLNVHWQAALVLELVCLVACTCRVVHLRLCLNPRDFWTDLKNCVVLVTLVVTIIDMVVWLSIIIIYDKSVIRVTRVLRPLLIVNFSENRNLRKLLRNIKRTVLDVASVLILIFLFIGVFAMMATKFFERRSLPDFQGDPYLDNFFDSYWNLYVLMTTANSPDVSLPAFKDEKAFFLFFAPFSVIATFILMNILLAVVYKHYRLHLIEEVRNDVGIIRHNLAKAFGLLKDHQTQHISKEVWERSYEKLGCTAALKTLYWEYLVPAGEDVPGISSAKFMEITDLLSSDIEVVMCKQTWLELHLPGLYNSSLSCYIRFSVDHLYFTIFYDFLIFANAVVLAVKVAPSFLETVFLVLFNIEILLKIYTYGPKKFASSLWNNYDCVVIWAATIFSLMVDVGGLSTRNKDLSNMLLDMVLTLRVLRLLKLLTSVPQLRLIINTLMHIVPSMGSYALLLFLFYYSYAIVGMELFGGKISNTTQNCGNPLLNGTEFVNENYCVLSFNDVLSSFVVLWTLTLVNQWHILAGGFVAVTQKAARLYFLSFHVIVVLIILNIFLAFVIEAFMLQIEPDSDKQEGIERHLEEQGVNARRDSRRRSQPIWFMRQSRHQSAEEVDGDTIFIGTQPLDKIKYKRQKNRKSYNQLLLDMFQGDIHIAADKQSENSTIQLPNITEVTQKVDNVNDPSKSADCRQSVDRLSMGSLDMDII